MGAGTDARRRLRRSHASATRGSAPPHASRSASGVMVTDAEAEAEAGSPDDAGAREAEEGTRDARVFGAASEGTRVDDGGCRSLTFDADEEGAAARPRPRAASREPPTGPAARRSTRRARSGPSRAVRDARRAAPRERICQYGFASDGAFPPPDD